MIATITHWIALHGYGVIFGLFAFGIVGLPVPDEWLLAYLGHLIFKGRLAPAPTVAAAFLGSICGMTLSYTLGRTFGFYLVHKFGSLVRLTPEKILRMRHWYERSGRWALLLGYFLPGVRHVTAITAGTSKMTFRAFALFAYPGGFAWSSAFIYLGYFLQEEWSRKTGKIHSIMELGTVAGLVVLTGYLLWKKGRQAKTKGTNGK
jgi:membrane protein DedA with SNARE-associated domain